MTDSFPSPVNPSITIFFAKLVWIKSKYEFIDSTHTLNEIFCPSYESSVCVGVFVKLATGSQTKG